MGSLSKGSSSAQLPVGLSSTEVSPSPSQGLSLAALASKMFFLAGLSFNGLSPARPMGSSSSWSAFLMVSVLPMVYRASIWLASKGLVSARPGLIGLLSSGSSLTGLGSRSSSSKALLVMCDSLSALRAVLVVSALTGSSSASSSSSPGQGSGSILLSDGSSGLSLA